MIQNVPVASLICMAVSAIICFGLPIGLCIYAVKVKKARLGSVALGAMTFFIAVQIAERIVYQILASVMGALLGNLLIYGICAALLAAVFEETGRFLAFKFFMKDNVSQENAFAYGVGHGGMEAMMITGMVMINNITISLAINQGSLNEIFETMDDAAKNNLSALWTESPFLFLAGGVERIAAVAIQIALSILVYKMFETGKKDFLLLAMACHFVIDFLTVMLSAYCPVWATEIIILLCAASMCRIAYLFCKQTPAGSADTERKRTN